MLSDRLLDHFRNPRNIGELQKPAVTVEASNPACGDRISLSVRLEGDRIAEVRYRVKGCAPSVAAGSALTELLSGRPAATLRALGTAELEEALGGLSTESRHAAVLCLDAVRAVEKELGL